MILSDYITATRELIHDLAGTDWTDAELTTHVNSARQRVALDTHCVRYLQTSLNTVPNQETYTIPVNVIDILGVSVIWGLMRYTLNWLPFTPFQAFCRANTTALSRPGIWTSYDAMGVIYLYPIPDQVYAMEWDTISLPTDLTTLTQIDTQVIQPWADAVRFYAAHLALLKLQNFAQAEYMNRKYEARCGQIIRTKQDRRDPNVYRTWWRRMNRM